MMLLLLLLPFGDDLSGQLALLTPSPPNVFLNNMTQTNSRESSTGEMMMDGPGAEEGAAGRGLSAIIMASARASLVHGNSTRDVFKANVMTYKGRRPTPNHGNQREKCLPQSETHETCEMCNCQKLIISP